MNLDSPLIGDPGHYGGTGLLRPLSYLETGFLPGVSVQIAGSIFGESGAFDVRESGVTHAAQYSANSSGGMVMVYVRAHQIATATLALIVLLIEHVKEVLRDHPVVVESGLKRAFRVMPRCDDYWASFLAFTASSDPSVSGGRRKAKSVIALYDSTNLAFLLPVLRLGEQFYLFLKSLLHDCAARFALAYNSKPVSRARMELGKVLVDLAARTYFHSTTLARSSY